MTCPGELPEKASSLCVESSWVSTCQSGPLCALNRPHTFLPQDGHLCVWNVSPRCGHGSFPNLFRSWLRGRRLRGAVPAHCTGSCTLPTADPAADPAVFLPCFGSLLGVGYLRIPCAVCSFSGPCLFPLQEWKCAEGRSFVCFVPCWFPVP